LALLGGAKNSGDLGRAPLDGDVADPLEIYFSPPVLPRQIWSRSNLSSVIMETCQKNLTPHARHLRSLKVIGTDMDWSATYDFLLVFHSNYCHMSYHLRDKWRYLQTVSHPFVFNAPLRGFAWNFLTAVRLRTLEWCPYQKVKEVWRYVHSSWHSRLPALDRQTDGRTDRIGKTISHSARAIKTVQLQEQQLALIVPSMHAADK